RAGVMAGMGGASLTPPPGMMPARGGRLTPLFPNKAGTGSPSGTAPLPTPTPKPASPRGFTTPPPAALLPPPRLLSTAGPGPALAHPLGDLQAEAARAARNQIRSIGPESGACRRQCPNAIRLHVQNDLARIRRASHELHGLGELRDRVLHDLVRLQFAAL